jgi:hypothetical protein
MAAIVIWCVTVGVGLCLLVVTAALKKLAFNAFICALISINFCIMVLREHERPTTRPGQLLELMAVNARYQGCNWLWMSLALLALHPISGGATTGYALGGLAAAVLCLCFGTLIRRALVDHPERVGRFLGLAWFMAFAQVVGAGVTIAGLVTVSMGPGDRLDWPSLNVIAFSSVALAVISTRALLSLATGAATPVAPAAAANAPVRTAATQPWQAPRASLRGRTGT